jgi:hypothetical protein
MHTKAQPLFAKLTKAVVVIVAAFFGNANAAAPDRIFDETVQLNPSESSITVKSERRSGDFTRRVVAATYNQRQEPTCLARATEALMNDSEGAPASSDQYVMPHTSFGAGSIALSALGNGASVPLTPSF